MDSTIDLSGESSMGIQEANARLHKMEDSLQRLEELVLQLIGGGSGDSPPAENELEQEQSTGVLE
jgi:hypothetical protein